MANKRRFTNMPPNTIWTYNGRIVGNTSVFMAPDVWSRLDPSGKTDSITIGRFDGEWYIAIPSIDAKNTIRKVFKRPNGSAVFSAAGIFNEEFYECATEPEYFKDHDWYKVTPKKNV